MNKPVNQGPEIETGEAFDEAYASLNAIQRLAVDTIEGPVLVVAGPGTGKTEVLTLRIANILRLTDTVPEQILALTFTESGAKAMRERLRLYIGSLAYQVPIYTFHGFTARLISHYPDLFGEIVGGRPLTDLEKVSIIIDCLETKNIKNLRPSGRPDYYVKPIIRKLQALKQENITPNSLATVIKRQEDELADTPKLMIVVCIKVRCVVITLNWKKSSPKIKIFCKSTETMKPF